MGRKGTTGMETSIETDRETGDIATKRGQFVQSYCPQRAVVATTIEHPRGKFGKEQYSEQRDIIEILGLHVGSAQFKKLEAVEYIYQKEGYIISNILF